MSSVEAPLQAAGLAVRRFPCRGRAVMDSPLVLIHGWAADSRYWQPLIDELCAHHELWTVDLPGFGASAPGVRELPTLLDDLAGVLPEQAVLVGWSLGGMLATLLAERRPERVVALVTLATNGCYVARPDWPDALSRDTFDEFCAAFDADPALCLKRFGGLQAHGDAEARALTRALRALQVIPDPAQVSAWRDSLTLLDALDIRPALAGLRCPSLHLFGNGDVLVPVGAAGALPTGPQATVERLRDCGHAPQLSQPPTVAGHLERFFRAQGLIGHADQLDKREVARSFSRAAARYDSAAHLQRRVGEHLIALLPRREPTGTVLDLGCGTGYFAPALQAAFPAATVLGCDLAEGMVAHARQHRDDGIRWLCGDAEQLPLADAAVDLIFSSLAFQWCEHWPRLAGELFRVLAPGGRVVFSTLGPRTLMELRAAWAAVDDAVHVNRFPAGETVCEALQQAGFARVQLDPVDEVVHYPTVAPLLRELKTIGAHNLNRGRHAGLTGRARLRGFEAAYEQFRQPGGLPATWAVHYVVASKH